MKSMKIQVANCLRQVLEGRVSLDHLIEEFKQHDDMIIAEVYDFVEKTSKKYNRYAKPLTIDKQDIKKIEEIITKLERPD